MRYKPVKVVPDDEPYSVRLRRQQQTKIVSLNKERAARMERRVVKKLRGNRVPMSGSGALKGDGMVYRSFGLMLVECKMSSQVDNKQGANLRFMYSWLPKLEEDVASMKARFGVVVIYFHGDTTDYVAVRREVYEQYFGPAAEFEMEWESSTKGYKIFKHRIKPLTYRGIIKLTTPIGELFILGINYFTELLDEHYAEVSGYPG